MTSVPPVPAMRCWARAEMTLASGRSGRGPSCPAASPAHLTLPCLPVQRGLQGVGRLEPGAGSGRRCGQHFLSWQRASRAIMQTPSSARLLASGLQPGCNQIIHSPASGFQKSAFVCEVICWLSPASPGPLLPGLSHIPGSWAGCTWPRAGTCLPGLRNRPKPVVGSRAAGPLLKSRV